MDEMLKKQDVLDAIFTTMDKTDKPDVILGLAAAMSTVKQMQAAPVNPAEKVMRWIPVNERLPEFTINKVGTQFTEDVLVYDGTDLRVGYFARKDKLDCDYWVVYGDDYFEPIAWMPLPEPYKASPTGAESEVQNETN